MEGFFVILGRGVLSTLLILTLLEISREVKIKTARGRCGDTVILTLLEISREVKIKTARGRCGDTVIFNSNPTSRVPH